MRDCLALSASGVENHNIPRDQDMAFPDGFIDVPPGKIAAIITYLEMLRPAAARPAPALPDIGLRHVEAPEAAWYRKLYARVGAQDWLWSSRLEFPVLDLEAVIQHPGVQIYALTENGNDEGLLELDFRVEGACELAFFGLTRGLIGRGAGRFLMNQAIALAWARPIQRFWLHTCTLDHPDAVGFYMRSGFTPFRRQIEIADDPRLDGVLPETAAPQMPIIRPPA